MRYLTIGSCLMNEDTYMIDFVKYHRAVGVEHFVFFDREYNRLSELFKDYDDVEVIHFPNTPENVHQEAWGQLIKYNIGKTKWLSLIDADQCLVPVKNNDVKKVLKDYEDFSCLQINWKTFGSSHAINRDPGSVYERFLLTCENNSVYNTHCQFICQPDRVLPIKTAEPHYCFLPEGEKRINTNKEEITENKIISLNPNTPLSFNDPPLHDILWCAHYTNKSKEEWLIKNNKGRADIFGAKMPKQQFDEYEACCNEVVELRARDLWKLSK